MCFSLSKIISRKCDKLTIHSATIHSFVPKTFTHLLFVTIFKKKSFFFSSSSDKVSHFAIVLPYPDYSYELVLITQGYQDCHRTMLKINFTKKLIRIVIVLLLSIFSGERLLLLKRFRHEFQRYPMKLRYCFKTI